MGYRKKKTEGEEIRVIKERLERGDRRMRYRNNRYYLTFHVF